MKVYIIGPITGVEGYKDRFDGAEKILRAQGHTPMNPTVLPPGFEHHEYVKICFSMLDVCEAVLVLTRWERSKGAKMEVTYAMESGKKIGLCMPEIQYISWLE